MKVVELSEPQRVFMVELLIKEARELRALGAKYGKESSKPFTHQAAYVDGLRSLFHNEGREV